jgi:oxaloacetate decarboxylase (Na+ extruding) subunit gamma
MTNILPQQLLQQGLDLMIYGMVTVFIFLALLVTVITLVSAIIRRFFSEILISELTVSKLKVSELAASGAASDKPDSTGAQVDHKLLTILQNAVDQHRADK